SVSLGSRTGATEFFTGTLDDARIYNRALSGTEISALAAGNGPATSATINTFADGLATTSDLIIASGTVVPAGAGISVGGSWLNYGGAFSPGGGTVTLTGNGTSNV